MADSGLQLVDCLMRPLETACTASGKLDTCSRLMLNAAPSCSLPMECHTELIATGILERVSHTSMQRVSAILQACSALGELN